MSAKKLIVQSEPSPELIAIESGVKLFFVLSGLLFLYGCAILIGVVAVFVPLF